MLIHFLFQAAPQRVWPSTGRLERVSKASSRCRVAFR